MFQQKSDTSVVRESLGSIYGLAQTLGEINVQVHFVPKLVFANSDSIFSESTWD